jgi:NNP family nitrate/nitrite transporter-like MFS transporter
MLALVPLAFLGWFGMNNLLPISPAIGGGSTISAFIKVLWLYGLAACVTAGVGLYLYLPVKAGGLELLNMWVALPLIMVSTLLLMRVFAIGEMKAGIQKQFAIFSNKHTWSLTALYLVTFGSFIGFAAAVPLAITVIFGDTHTLNAATGLWEHVKNPNAPSALTYAWIGPFVGALIRPIGGMDFRQGGRFHRHPDHLRGHGRGLGLCRLHHDAGLSLGHAGESISCSSW